MPNTLVELAAALGRLEGSARALTDSKERALEAVLDRYPNLLSVLVVGGFPCRGLSRANPRRKNLSGARSNLVWVLAVVIVRAHFLVKNVVMDSEAEDVVSRLLNTQPRRVDAAEVSPMTRARTIGPRCPLRRCSERAWSQTARASLALGDRLMQLVHAPRPRAHTKAGLGASF